MTTRSERMTEPEYVAQMVFLALLNLHMDGINSALDNWIDDLPPSVRTELESHVKGTMRLGETIGAMGS